MKDESAPRVALNAARVAEIDEAMWLRAREGDVAAAKVIYARLSEILPPATPQTVPKWAEIEAMFYAVLNQQKELNHEHGVLDDAAELDSGARR